MKSYQICTRCIMDTTDPDIFFDEEGVCNHCHEYDNNVSLGGYKGDESKEKLHSIIQQIKEDGKDKQYDCILGVSGGVDSSYLIDLTHQLGLRPLLVHVDAGWNTELAESNLYKLSRGIGREVQRIVVDPKSIIELQRAFMFSGLPNLDIPQDHAFLAGVYEHALKHGIKYMINGSNFATEGILPQSWGYAAIDYKHIKSVYLKHGRGKDISKYPHFGVLKYIRMQSRVKRINLLNYVDYSLNGAISYLSDKFGWQYYGGKHFESRFTRFFQSCYLPEKFGYDKRRAHLASLVVSGEISRAEAISKMKNDSFYTDQQKELDKQYILEKLEISDEKWKQIMSAPIRTEQDYSSNKNLIQALVNIKRQLR